MLTQFKKLKGVCYIRIDKIEGMEMLTQFGEPVRKVMTSGGHVFFIADTEDNMVKILGDKH